MRKALLIIMALLLLTGASIVGCAAPPTKPEVGLQTPKVELARVEVAGYFPYAPPPTRVPLVLAFIFTINNSNDFKVMLEDMKFTVSFEAAPGEYFALITPMVYENMYIPPKTTNQLRVVAVLDSAVAPGTLALTSGHRLLALGLKPPDVVKTWWENIGDFAFGIKVTEGTASFTSDQGSTLATFEGQFPKK
ncbi:MAG: hypothetical protein HY998_04605 [candidate division NC10 bacterium]|nr:hypothetical protein [candidate division NC10 bacterium]